MKKLRRYSLVVSVSDVLTKKTEFSHMYLGQLLHLFSPIRFGFPVTLTPSTHFIKACYFLWTAAASVLGTLYCPKRQKENVINHGLIKLWYNKSQQMPTLFFKAESHYAIYKGQRCEQQIHDEKMTSMTLSIKENIVGNAIDQIMLIGQNTHSNRNFTEFLIRCYQYIQNPIFSKTRILEKDTSGDTCGQHISNYRTSLSPKYYLPLKTATRILHCSSYLCNFWK